MKETVQYIDETSVEVEINRLGFRQATQIAKKHIPIKDLSFSKDDNGNDVINIKGDIDMMGMMETVLLTVKGLDLDKLSSSEANRLYKKYFERDVMSSLGQGGNPN